MPTIMLENRQIPVLLLTGYLGSGKTTLLNRILANRKGIKFAVIVNDIGEVNIDASLIEKGGVVGSMDDSLIALDRRTHGLPQIRLHRHRGQRHLRAGPDRPDDQHPAAVRPAIHP